MRVSFRLIVCGAIALAATLTCDSVFGQARTATRTAPPAAGRPAPAASRPPADTARTAAMSTAGSKIAVIDISYVFKNHNRFKQMMEDMRKDVEAFETVLKQRSAEMQQKQQQLQELRPGTPDYDRLERDMASFQAQVQAETQLKRKEFLQREARIYYNVYTEIVKEVSYFAQQNGIDLVIRFNSEDINPEDRKSVLEGVNRAVVHQSHLNITPHILDRLNGPATARPGPPVSRR